MGNNSSAPSGATPKEYTENATDKTVKEAIYVIQTIEQAIKELKYAEDSFEPRAQKAIRNANNKSIELVKNRSDFCSRIIADAVSKDIISIHDASELVSKITKRTANILQAVRTAEPFHKKLIEQRNKLSEQNQINALNTLNNELENVQEKAKAKAKASMESTKNITTAIQSIMSGYERHIPVRERYVEPGPPNGGRRKSKRKKHRKRTQRKRR